MSYQLWTYQHLAKRWDVSVCQARRIVKARGLEPVDLGHRTKRFRPSDVERLEAPTGGKMRQRAAKGKGGTRRHV